MLETDDEATILGKLRPEDSEAELRKADTDKSRCFPSQDVWTHINRQSTLKMKWVRLARAHCAALSVCEDGFPGYARQEALVRRAATRATTVINYPNEVLTNQVKEMVRIHFVVVHDSSDSAQVLGSIEELYQRVTTAAEDAVQEHYFGTNRILTSTEAFAVVSSAVCDDNYIYQVWSTRGDVSTITSVIWSKRLTFSLLDA